MNGHGMSADDVSAVIDQGDYLGLLQSLAKPQPQTRQPRPARQLSGGPSFPRTAPPKSRPDGRAVGAWPAGCGRPGDPFPHHPAA